MKADFCIMCGRWHESFAWRYQEWKPQVFGWSCEQWFKPKTYEFVPERIKQDRVKYAKDLVQPRREGQLSKEFVDLYPKRAKKMFSKEEIKSAKPVWRKDIKGL